MDQVKTLHLTHLMCCTLNILRDLHVCIHLVISRLSFLPACDSHSSAPSASPEGLVKTLIPHSCPYPIRPPPSPDLIEVMLMAPVSRPFWETLPEDTCSHLGWFCPPENSSTIWRLCFVLSRLGWGRYLAFPWGEAREAVRTLHCTGQLPRTKDYPAPKVNSAKVEKPCPRRVLLKHCPAST